jgi:hypothetical protein
MTSCIHGINAAEHPLPQNRNLARSFSGFHAIGVIGIDITQIMYKNAPAFIGLE